jgi:hypothetical protein
MHVTEPTSAPAAPTASLWEDFIDIFTSPSSVFRRRATSGFGVPLLILTVLLGILIYGTRPLVQPAIEGDTERAFAKVHQAHPEIPAEQLQKQQAIGEKFGPVFIIIAIPIMAMLTGLVLTLVGKMFGSTLSPSQGIMVATYAFLTKILASVAGAIIALLSSPERLTGMTRLTAGVAQLFDPATASPIVLALVARLDVFTIWETILLAIGLQAIGKVSKSDSYIAAALVWIIGALPGVLQALRS